MLRYLSPSVRACTVSDPHWVINRSAPFRHLPRQCQQHYLWPIQARNHHVGERMCHREGEIKSKDKEPKKKQPYAAKPCSLRPEDVSAAARAARAEEKCARAPPPAAEKHAKKKRSPCQPCPPQPPPPPSHMMKAIPTRPRQKPQPTRTLMPQDVTMGGPLPPQFDACAGATPSRPVITRIRMCTPQEVRKLFEPVPIICPPIRTPITFRRRVLRMIFFTMKCAFATFVVWLSIDLGIWNNSEKTAELLSAIRYGDSHHLPPHAATIMYKIKDTWNRAVIAAFWYPLHIPEYVERLWKYTKKEKEEEVLHGSISHPGRCR